MSTIDRWDAEDTERNRRAIRATMTAALQDARDLADIEAINAGDVATARRVLAAGPPPAEPSVIELVERRRASIALQVDTAVRFLTPRELAATGSIEPDWIIHGLLARQAITELDGKVKAAGKTTLLLFVVRAVLDGSPFLGYPTQRTNVVLLSEQQSSPLLSALFRAGLHDRDDGLRILLRSMFGGLTWPQIIERAAAECRATDAGLLVVDTIGKLAGIRNENEAGEWSACMSPLMDLTQQANLATAIARHDRKSGGEVGESGRGSSQGSGDVDIILALRRPEGQQPGTRRVIESLSRYAETPEKIVVELQADGYVLLGSEEAVATAEARDMLLLALGSEYRQDESGPTQKELVELGASHLPKVGRWAIQEALAALIAEGQVVTTGTPRSRKDPLRYSLQALAGTRSIGGSGNTVSEESEEDLIEQATAWRFGTEPEPEAPEAA